MMNDATLEQRVRAGSAWLDKHRPGWDQEIDLEKLAMCDCERCIIGQLIGWYPLITWLGDVSRKGLPRLTDDDAKRLGFDLSDTGTYSELRNAWKSEIIARRKEPVHA